MSARFGLELDPEAIAAERTPLNLNSGAIQTVGGEGHGIDWGEAAIKAFTAEQQFGESATEYRVPNRTITIPLILVGNSSNPTLAAEEQEAARRKLEQKVGLLQREGGILMRQRSNGEPLYADIVTATLIVPDVWEGQVEPNVVLKLECRPDFYGEEIELDSIEETGQIAAVLKQGGSTAVIAGDHPGRARLVCTEKSAHNQRGLFWGLRSLHYDSSATAALFYDAYTLSTLNGAVTGTESLAYSGKVAKITAPVVKAWHPFLELKPPAGHMSHLGSYRLWLRAAAPVGVRIRLVWSTDDATASLSNASASFIGTGSYELIDLGEIRIEEPPVGEHWWNGVLQVETGATSHEVVTDRLWLQPLDDGAGRLRATGVPTSELIAVEKPSGATAESSTIGTGGTVAWTHPTNIETGHSGETEILVGAGKSGESLLVKGWGFALPSGAHVKGIKVTVNAAPGGFIGAWLTLAGATFGEQGANQASEARQNFTWGGPNSLWGTSVTATQANETSFGVLVLPINSAAAYAVFSVSMTVYFSFGSGAITQDAVLYSERKAEIRTEGAFREDTATEAYVNVSEQTGDLVRIPPSSLEQRPCQLLVKNSRGLLPEPGTGTVIEEDPGKDKIKAQVFYRPCYIGRI